MAARIGENSILNPAYVVMRSFHLTPVKFSTFVNALKAHYQGNIPSYEDVAIAALQQLGSYNSDIKERDSNLTLEQQSIIEDRVITLLHQKTIETSHAPQGEWLPRENMGFKTDVVLIAGMIFLFAVCMKFYLGAP